MSYIVLIKCVKCVASNFLEALFLVTGISSSLANGRLLLLKCSLCNCCKAPGCSANAAECFSIFSRYFDLQLTNASLF